MKYYSLSKIDAKDATYNLIIGERSNGKTYAMLTKVLKQYLKDGKQFAYVRRWKEDITGRRAQRLFASLNEDGSVEKYSNGEYKGIYYYAGKFYLCNYDANGKAIYGDTDIIGFTFALSDGEHDKSTSFPNVTIIVFDEFLTNQLYLNDEFVSFMNTVSTIVRRRTDVKIYMLGNTVNKFCPYFKEMGLENVTKMEQGTIDVYRYGDSKLTVAVEYCETADKKANQQSNKYFAFNNPKLQMITGGAWELSIYPHLPMKYKPMDVLLTFYIIFASEIYACEVISKNDTAFIYIHAKTTPIKDTVNSLIYSLDYNSGMNYNRSVFKPMNKLQQKIAWFFKNDKVFYQDNSIGDAVNNYLKICKRL